MAELFNDPIQILDYIHDLFDENSEQFGLGFVGYGAEELRPRYPALIVNAGPLAREYHATHTFQLTVIIEMWVYHANFNVDHRVRTREDLQLAKGIRDFLHTRRNMEMWDENDKKQIIQGWISGEDPAFIRRPTQSMVVGTRLEWTGITQERFPKEG